MTPDPAALRARLVELQADTVRRLIAELPVVDAGLLALIAHTHAVLAALDAATAPYGS